jgi:hypothetical protein
MSRASGSPRFTNEWDIPTWQNRFTQRSARRPAFVLLGRANRLAGRDARAIESLERAVTIAPSDDNLSELERARLFYMHRVGTQVSPSSSTARHPTAGTAKS